MTEHETEATTGAERPFLAMKVPIVPVDPPSSLTAAVRARLANAMSDDAQPLSESLRRRLLNLARVTQPPVEPAAAERSRRPVVVVTGLDDPTPTLVPALHVDDADAAVGFLADAFGATVSSVVPGADGTIAEVRLRIGSSTILLVERPGQERSLVPGRAGGATATMHLEVVDLDDVVARAESVGALVVQRVRDLGSFRRTVIEDPSGHHWVLTGAAHQSPHGP